jgi:hypothetical protein
MMSHCKYFFPAGTLSQLVDRIWKFGKNLLENLVLFCDYKHRHGSLTKKNISRATMFIHSNHACHPAP